MIYALPILWVTRLARSLIIPVVTCIGLLALGSSTPVSAQEKPAPGPTNLNLEATDPLASFRQIQLRANFNTSRWQRDDGSTDYEFRTIFPYRAWHRPNIIRTILPFTSEPAGASALKDIEILNLAVFDSDWGQTGYGLAASVATNALGENEDDFSLGPAAGFIASPSKDFQWGFLNKNFLTGRPTVSTLQPILTYALGNGWDIGLSTMQFAYDWHERQLISAPLGFSVGKVFDAGSQPFRIFMESEYNFKDIAGSSKFRVLLGLSLLAGR